MGDNWITYTMTPHFFDSNVSLVNAVNSLFNQHETGVLFTYDETFHAIKRNIPEYKVQVSRNLGLLLGYGNQDTSYSDWINVEPGMCPSSMDRFRGIHSVYLYSDIIKYQYVGSVMSPLLRIIPLKPYKGGERPEADNHHFPNPIYFPVSRKHIEHIEINLLDVTGKRMSFLGGTSTITLHFRRRLPTY